MSRVRRISYAISKDGRRSTAVQQAIRIRDLALSIVEEANFSAQRTRRVTKKAAFTVVLRSLQQSHDMPFSLREHLAIKELNHYISLAQTNKLNSLTLSHTDLLPISHPRSTREHSMTASGLREANSRWYADDSRITDERARSILASAYSAKFGSVEHTYFTSLLSGLPQGSIPGEALIAAFGDGNSSAARSLRARLQRRDRFGQFAFMGGGMRALIRMAKDGVVRSLVGRPIADGPDGDDVQVELPNGKIVNIPASKGEFISAVINPTKDGYSPVPAKVSTEDNDVIINEPDLKFADAPAGWTKLGAITYKNGDWTVTRNEVLNEWEASNPNGDYFQEKSWSDILDKIDTADSQRARVPKKEEKKKAFEFNYPDGAYKIAPNVSYDPQGRVDEESSDYTDDYVELAQNQDERDLIAGLEQAVIPQEGGGAALGNGALAFNKGDEWVPAEAIYLAINEAGGDAEMELAKIYDKILGGSDNQDALKDFRKKSESVTGETPRLDKAFERVAGKDSGEDVLPATEEPAFDPAEMDKVPLPPLLEGLSEKEISDYQETKDHTPYLPKNEDIAMPVGYKELSPEPYKSWREVTKDNPEESFPVGWNDNPFYLAQSIDKKSLEAELRRSIEPGNEIPGAALISLPTEDGEDFTAHVPGEAVRDALQLQGVDTNKIIKDIAAEGFIGQKDEAIAQIPEGVDKKGADPIAEGWTSSDWLNEDGSAEFHDLIKANEDFTRLAGFYNDAKIDSPLMSDYQEKDMLGNLGIDATDEINAIDKGLKFEAGPSAKVGYALNLLDNPDFSLNPDFKKDANGERSDTTKIAILKSADENLASAVADLKADSPEVNAINSVRKSIADQIASLETPKEATPDVAPEAPEKDITGYKVVASGADKVYANGTSLQGNISATRKELEAIFGKPDTYEDDKVKVSWSLKFEGPDGTEIATIYDWKNDNALGDDEVYDWHIGGNNPLAVELVKNAFNPPEDIKPIELTPESKYADLVFDGDVSLEDQIKNAIEKGMRIGFFYNGSHRLVTPIDIYTNPKNGNVNVRTKDENGDHRTFTIGNMEDGKDKSDVSLEEQRVLDNNEWVEANAGLLNPILPQDLKKGDFYYNMHHHRYEEVVEDPQFIGGFSGRMAMGRYKFQVLNLKNNQIEIRYFYAGSPLHNWRRPGQQDETPIPQEPKRKGAGGKRGAILARPIGERIVPKEGRVLAGDWDKKGYFKDKNGELLKPGDVVIHQNPKLQAKYGKGIVKVRIGAQVEEGAKAKGLGRGGKMHADYVMIVWEKDKENAPREYKAGRPMVAGNLIKQDAKEPGAPVAERAIAPEVPKPVENIKPDVSEETIPPVPELPVVKSFDLKTAKAKAKELKTRIEAKPLPDAAAYDMVEKDMERIKRRIIERLVDTNYKGIDYRNEKKFSYDLKAAIEDAARIGWFDEARELMALKDRKEKIALRPMDEKFNSDIESLIAAHPDLIKFHHAARPKLNYDGSNKITYIRKALDAMILHPDNYNVNFRNAYISAQRNIAELEKSLGSMSDGIDKNAIEEQLAKIKSKFDAFGELPKFPKRVYENPGQDEAANRIAAIAKEFAGIDVDQVRNQQPFGDWEHEKRMSGGINYLALYVNKNTGEKVILKFDNDQGHLKDGVFLGAGINAEEIVAALYKDLGFASPALKIINPEAPDRNKRGIAAMELADDGFFGLANVGKQHDINVRGLDEVSPEHQAELLDFVVANGIIGNSDRHGGNFMWGKGADGKLRLIPIDNGMAIFNGAGYEAEQHSDDALYIRPDIAIRAGREGKGNNNGVAFLAAEYVSGIGTTDAKKQIVEFATRMRERAKVIQFIDERANDYLVQRADWVLANVDAYLAIIMRTKPGRG